MFELDIVREFSAAHHLEGYPGNCAHVHGHNWTVQIFIRAEKLDEVGIAMDFKVLKKELDEVLATLDHNDLNTLPEFQKKNPSSENLARYIYTFLAGRLNDGNVKIHKVRICESPTSGASYFEE